MSRKRDQELVALMRSVQVDDWGSNATYSTVAILGAQKEAGNSGVILPNVNYQYIVLYY
jgi:hypothetical protein